MIIINIAEDFTKTPGGRYINEGDYSGELFRNSILAPKYKEAKEKNEKLKVIMDGCLGYPSSFLDESFGGLARELNDKHIMNNIIFVSEDQPNLVDYIKSRVEI